MLKKIEFLEVKEFSKNLGYALEKMSQTVRSSGADRMLQTFDFSIAHRMLQ